MCARACVRTSVHFVFSIFATHLRASPKKEISANRGTHTVCSIRNVTICVEHTRLYYMYVVRKQCTSMEWHKTPGEKRRERRRNRNSHNKFQWKRCFPLFLLSSAIFHKQWHTHIFNVYLSHAHIRTKAAQRKTPRRDSEISVQREWMEANRGKVFAHIYRCIANVSNQNTSKTKTTTTNDMECDEMRKTAGKWNV